ncbi:MAG: ABC transporter ATP-binding protein [Defluviitaleaceae bacterium]|nr:ABC transporter ATP-binding protein [Defluviitaleaceae bacterium]
MKADYTITINIDIKNLKVNIRGNEVLKGIDFSLKSGEAVAIVGESGSGKTMLTRSLIGLLPTAANLSGIYEIDGTSFNLNSKEKDWRKIRGNGGISMIMQDPFTALDPSKICGKQILDGVPKDSHGDFDITTALAEVGLDANIAGRYPSQLSGGQRQRVVIAAALATKPRLLIADEATTALDVITQKEILELINKIRAGRQMPIIIITHDIHLARHYSEKIFVMDKGCIVESGNTEHIIENPKKESTKALLSANRFLKNLPYASDESKAELILSVKSLSKTFGKVQALDDVSINVYAGESVGIVGQSGSGKTTLARCIIGLTGADSGKIEYFGKVAPQIVFQDPYSSLNPAHTIRYVLEEALEVSNRPKEELMEILSLAEVDEKLLYRKPSDLSGGQRQRIAIARALAPRTDLLICDESVSALDVIVQNQILKTLENLRKTRNMAILFITHDLSVLRMLASRVYVMNKARVVEHGSTQQIFESAKDEYTKKLIEASVF